jgi:hypothetical protein
MEILTGFIYLEMQVLNLLIISEKKNRGATNADSVLRRKYVFPR